MPGARYGEERERVAAASRRLAAEGLVIGTAGNVSLRCGDVALVSPSGAALATLEPEDLVEVDVEGGRSPASGAPTSELALHLGAMRSHGAVAVVHTHSPLATAVGCVVDEVPVVHYTMARLGGAVPVIPYRTFGTPELARTVVDGLAGRRAVLMANHGAVVHAGTIEEGAELALLLEWACGVYWHACALGTPRVLDAAEQREAAARLGVDARGGA